MLTSIVYRVSSRRLFWPQGGLKRIQSSNWRNLHSSVPSIDAEKLSAPAKPAEETEDVTAIDTLMTVIRKRTNPLYRSTLPLRTPLLWSETLSSKPSQALRTTPPPLPLPTRAMQDSYAEFLLPFHTQPVLLEQYTNAQGGLRIGKLMEHLDSLAGSIAYKHVLGPDVETISANGGILERGFYIVTAAVDRLDMLRPLAPGGVRDLRLCGNVIYTGRSSMEIVVKMELLQPGGAEETVLLGRFSMVARDAFTNKATPIPPLKPSTQEEEVLSSMGEAHKARKKALALRSLDRVPPSSEEAATLHQLFLLHKNNSDVQSTGIERVWLEDTALENCLLMFPQERNVHSKIFGGYLMRLAYELSGTAASLFARRPLRFLSLDGLSFNHPVPIGSILRLRGRTVCTESTDVYPALAHATVKANVVDVETGTELTTNDFRFTWCDEQGPQLRRAVVPRTYQDAMEWLEGKRALDLGDEIRKLRERSRR